MYKFSSLWDTITAQCSSTELSEVKRVIGESLVEQACDLHTEANSLREILEDNTTMEPSLNRATVHTLTKSVSDLVKHLKSNKVSQTNEATMEIRKLLHLESVKLRLQISRLQEELDQKASITATGGCNKPDSIYDQSSSSDTRLNSAQRFRQMITNSRNFDIHDSSQN